MQAAQMGLSAADLQRMIGMGSGQLAGQEADISRGIGMSIGQLGQQQGGLEMQAAQMGLSAADLQRMIGMGTGQLAGQEADISRGLGMGIGSLGSELGQLGVSQAQLGALQSNLIGADVQRLAGMGEMEREQQQRVLDAQRQTQIEQLYQPYQDLAFRSDIFRGAPSTQMALTASTSPQPSVFQQAAGLGIAGLSAARGEKSGLFG
jgi:hypothetical protein